MTNRTRLALLLLAATSAVAQPAATPAAPQPDPWVAKNRVLVLSDIANEPDDQMSMVRFLVYSNEFDIEGLVASTSTWLRNGPRPDVILKVIDAYDQVRPNLLKNSPDYPTTEFLRKAVTTGQTSYGMAAVGPDHMSPGAERIIQAVDDGVRRNDPRPLWITVWGGANTLAQALQHVQQTRSPADLESFLSRLRVYTTGRESSRDTVTGIDGKPHTSDQATIWRWRTAFQNDFAARMEWTVNEHGNHNPQVIVNGEAGRAPIIIHAEPGKPVTLDAAGTKDPDGDALTYHWFFYAEAGRGSSALDREDGPVVHATLSRPGAAHVILAVEDKGTPSLTSYRRVILQTAPR